LNTQREIPELLIPAGNPRKARVALAYGADAIYAGAAGFSMRPDQASFSLDELAETLALAQSAGKKLYVAINSLFQGEELEQLRSWLKMSQGLAFDALILSDPGALLLVKELRPEIPIHISTQMSTANHLSLKFWAQMGAERVILARECSLAEVQSMAQAGSIPVEIFIHGAMCVAVSGRCLLSAHLTGRSASKGDCKHSCRWEWQLVEHKRPGETFPIFETGKETILLGSTDLCLIEHIPAVVESGACSLKVEGRMKGEHYVATVTRAYRAALDAYARDPESWQLDPHWLQELDAMAHRPYAAGFAFGYPHHDPTQLQTGNRVFARKEFLGIVEGFSGERLRLAVKGLFRRGEVLEWIGPQMRGGALEVLGIWTEEGEVMEIAHSGRNLELEVKVQGGPLPELAILRRPRKLPEI